MLLGGKTVRVRTVWSVDRLLKTDRKILVEIRFLRPILTDDVAGNIIALNATQLGLPALAGELGSTYVIPIIYVPLLMITHVVAFYLLVRQQWTAHRVIAANVAP